MKMPGMRSCEEMGELISQDLDRRLSTGERWSLRIHVAMCRYCRRFQRQVRWLSEAIAREREEEPVDRA